MKKASRLDQIDQIQHRNSHQKKTESVFSPSIPHQFVPILTNPLPLKLIDQLFIDTVILDEEYAREMLTHGFPLPYLVVTL